MKTIWKFKLNITESQEIKVPEGTQILSAGIDPEGSLCVWGVVDTENALTDRFIYIVGTGNPIDRVFFNDYTFIGSVLMQPFVWHVFECNSK